VLRGAGHAEASHPKGPEGREVGFALVTQPSRDSQRPTERASDTALRNVLVPLDAVAGPTGKISYSLPQGTFAGGEGKVELNATQRDGSPLPSWIKFDGAKGSFSADVPANLRLPIEIKIEARDSAGQKAETYIKIQPKPDRLGFVGKPSLNQQFQRDTQLYV
jgi:hypothetical protein